VFVNNERYVPSPGTGQVFFFSIFNVMVATPRVTYQSLTKPADRLAAMAPWLPSAPNIWIGASCASADYL
jgi:protein gp37